MNTGKFIISDTEGDLISIADRPNPYHTLILDALRNQQSVRHVGHGSPEIAPTPIAVRKPKTAALPEPKPAKKITRRRRATAAAEAPSKTSAETKTPWSLNEIVFIAWSKLTEAERETFNDIRESMGTVEEFRRGQGIRRTIGVKWDTRNDIEWHHPDDLSAVCDYCIEPVGQAGPA